MLNDLRQSEEWGRYLVSQGWKVEKLPIANFQFPIYVFIRKLPLAGSVIKIQRPSIIPPVEAIDKIAQKHRALFVKLEPLLTINYELLTSRGFVRDSSPSLPTKTIVINLTKSKEELWKTLSQDTRHDIRKAEESQLSVTSYQLSELEKQLKKFHQLLKETGRRQGFWPPSFNQLKAKTEAFGKNAVLFLARSPSYPVTQSPSYPLAGALVLLDGETAYYHYTATSIAGRKLNATYLLMWEIIKFLVTQSPSNPVTQLSLGSIYDPRYHKLTKSWQGFTLFKRKFGGKEIEYPAPLIKYYHPLMKLLFKLEGLF